MALSGGPIGLAFKLLMVVAMVAGVLMVVPQAQAQGAFTPGGQCSNAFRFGITYCIDKTASPAQATIGQPITFTITLSITTCTSAMADCANTDAITDTLPAGVTFVSATAANTFPQASQPTCHNAGNTVTCANMLSVFSFPSTATIVVTPTQCGTFTNTATSNNTRLSASADFTVVGCATPPPQQQQQNQQQNQQQQQPTCPPASIETGIEPQSGDVSLSSGTDNSGDYAHQVTPSVQTGDTGNLENSPSVLQTCGSTSGAIEPGGISKDINPVVDVSSPSTINQSSSS